MNQSIFIHDFDTILILILHFVTYSLVVHMLFQKYFYFNGWLDVSQQHSWYSIARSYKSTFFNKSKIQLINTI